MKFACCHIHRSESIAEIYFSSMGIYWIDLKYVFIVCINYRQTFWWLFRLQFTFCWNLTKVCSSHCIGTANWRDEADSRPPTQAADPNDSMSYRSRNPSSSADKKSSYQNAVYIYSGKLAPAPQQPRQRPSSAVSSTRTREFSRMVLLR